MLRTDLDWDRDLEPVDQQEHRYEFRWKPSGPYAYFKPVLSFDQGPRWSVGANYLVFTNAGPREVYPYFDEQHGCSVCDLQGLPDLEHGYSFRVFQPPGYHENHLKRYPVIYMQDGKNLFFADEAFAGQHWRVRETLERLTAMNIAKKVIVIGIYPRDRMRDYTKPGYETYGEFFAKELKPHVDTKFRTLPDRNQTVVMGSSLGGVVSFHLAWQYPDLIGKAACMSSTFGYQDDLRERVSREAKRPSTFYLDSGWPHDNYEATRSMRALLLRRGYHSGIDLHYFAFPEGTHNERSWAVRTHIPFQLFFGHKGVSTAASIRLPDASHV